MIGSYSFLPSHHTDSGYYEAIEGSFLIFCLALLVHPWDKIRYEGFGPQSVAMVHGPCIKAFPMEWNSAERLHRTGGTCSQWGDALMIYPQTPWKSLLLRQIQGLSLTYQGSVRGPMYMRCHSGTEIIISARTLPPIAVLDLNSQNPSGAHFS